MFLSVKLLSRSLARSLPLSLWPRKKKRTTTPTRRRQRRGMGRRAPQPPHVTSAERYRDPKLCPNVASINRTQHQKPCAQKKNIQAGMECKSSSTQGFPRNRLLLWIPPGWARRAGLAPPALLRREGHCRKPSASTRKASRTAGAWSDMLVCSTTRVPGRQCRATARRRIPVRSAPMRRL